MIENCNFEQELVDAISHLADGRLINIMDVEGVIIDSTDRKRIGEYHVGANKAIKENKTILIHNEELDKYPGCREGWNIPIRMGNKVIGVVGVNGNPDNVYEVANLIGVYVTQCIHQQGLMKKHYIEEEYRIRLLKSLLYDGLTGIVDIENLCGIVGVSIKFPIKIYLVSINGQDLDIKSKTKKLLSLQQKLINGDYINNKNDIYGVIEERLLIIKYIGKYCEGKDDFIEEIYNRFLAFEDNYKISSGEICETYTDIPIIHKQTLALEKFSKGSINNIYNWTSCQQYYLGKLNDGDNIKYILNKYKLVMEVCGQNEGKILFDSASEYYKEDRSITKAAKNLNVHKTHYYTD